MSERLRMWAWLSTVSVIYTPCYHRQTRIENWILSTRVKTDFNEEGNYMTLNSMGWNPFCWFILIFMHFWGECYDKEGAKLKVLFLGMSVCKNSSKFKIMLSYWSSFKLWLIFTQQNSKKKMLLILAL